MARKRKKKGRHVVGRTEALKRLDRMVAPVFKNVRYALALEATLESGNDEVGKRTDRTVDGADTYNVISNSLALHLALELSRLLDPGTRHVRINKRDVQSIPMLMHYLSQKRCREALAAEARRWVTDIVTMPDANERECLAAIDRATSAWRSLNASSLGRSAKPRLRAMRNSVLAHSLPKLPRTPPRYRELFQMLKIAAEIVENAYFAIKGQHRDIPTYADGRRVEANEFWTAAFSGLYRHERRP